MYLSSIAPTSKVNAYTLKKYHKSKDWKSKGTFACGKGTVLNEIQTIISTMQMLNDNIEHRLVITRGKAFIDQISHRDMPINVTSLCSTHVGWLFIGLSDASQLYRIVIWRSMALCVVCYYIIQDTILFCFFHISSIYCIYLRLFRKHHERRV